MKIFLIFIKLCIQFSEYHSRIGLVQFSTKTAVEFGLNQFKTKEDLFNGLDEAKGRYKNMGYNSYAGLKLGLDLFRFRRGHQTPNSEVYINKIINFQKLKTKF